MKIGTYHIAIGILLIASWFGFIGPYAVSSKDNTLVIGWIFLTLSGVVFIIEYIRRKKNG